MKILNISETKKKKKKKRKFSSFVVFLIFSASHYLVVWWQSNELWCWNCLGHVETTFKLKKKKFLRLMFHRKNLYAKSLRIMFCDRSKWTCILLLDEIWFKWTWIHLKCFQKNETRSMSEKMQQNLIDERNYRWQHTRETVRKSVCGWSEEQFSFFNLHSMQN